MSWIMFPDAAGRHHLPIMSMAMMMMRTNPLRSYVARTGTTVFVSTSMRYYYLTAVAKAEPNPDVTTTRSFSVAATPLKSPSTGNSSRFLLHSLKTSPVSAAMSSKKLSVFGRGITRFLTTAATPLVPLDPEDPCVDPQLESEPFYQVCIYYASQTGTAQLFGQDLQHALAERGYNQVTMQPLQDFSLQDTAKDTLYLFLVSTTGVGEPPDHARGVFQTLTQSHETADNFNFSVFGLGNQKAHPNHYNTVAKTLDTSLQEAGGRAVLPIRLGDDGDCIEDDFDQWLDQIMTVVKSTKQDNETEAAPEKVATISQELQQSHVVCSGKYPTLHLQETLSEHAREYPRHNLLDMCPSFYQDGSRVLSVTENRLLSSDPTTNGLAELRLDLPDNVTYETGDHLVLYPRNADFMIQAYLQVVADDVAPSTIIQEPSDSTYPHPTGITLYETLQHCVDLQATPSPSMARLLMDRPDVDYKREIAHAGRTILDLLLSMDKTIALEDLLYQLPPLQPRYYSIASSAAVHPHQVFLTYRPVQYITTRGALCHGVCTQYMSRLSPGTSKVVASVRSNPGFRLPVNQATTGVFMIAGGCGVAPIRAFLEERIQRAANHESLAPSSLFLGFRDQSDEVYGDFVQQALESGAITKNYLNFQIGKTTTTNGDDDNTEQAESLSAAGSVVKIGLVSDRVRQHGAEFWEHCQAGGVTYLCGGARTFGVAIENQVHAIFQEHGGLSAEEATVYLQELIRDGLFCEDLAD